MDITILYLIGFVIVAVGLIFLAKFLREKKIVNTEDMIFAMKLLQLTVDVVDQLNLQSETKIKSIAEIIVESIEYVSKVQDEQDKVALACEYAYGLCEQLNVALTEERKSIVKQLIEISLNK